MKLSCKHCGEPIRAEDMNLDRLIAKCQACHGVFDFSAELGGEAGPDAGARRPAAQLRRKVPLPPGLLVSEDEGEGFSGPAYRSATRERRNITVTRRWFQLSHLFMVFFVIAWDSFLVFWYGAAASSEGGASIIMFVFPIVHVAVGVGLTYTTVANLLNRTHIAVADDELRVRHGPVPWRGNQRISAHEVTQLYCEEQVHSGKQGVSRSYDVNVILSDGRTIKLLRKLSAPAQALYIEQAIEEAMGIVDVQVPGELKG